MAGLSYYYLHHYICMYTDVRLYTAPNGTRTVSRIPSSGLPTVARVSSATAVAAFCGKSPRHAYARGRRSLVAVVRTEDYCIERLLKIINALQLAPKRIGRIPDFGRNDCTPIQCTM
jgi:hypothetical protein